MKIETIKLKGKLLDWSVESIEIARMRAAGEHVKEWWVEQKQTDPSPYSTDLLRGGTILDQYDISVWLTFDGLGSKGKWSAAMPDWFHPTDPVPLQPEAAYGDTRLEAGMRALVRDKLGAEVDVPDELIRTLPSPDEEGLDEESDHA